MKRIVLFTLALVMALGITAWAQDVSLGDYARQQRAKEKPASPTTHVFTNDDIASAPPLDQATVTSDDKSKDSKTKDKDKEKDKTAAEKMSKEAEDFKAKVAEQKDKIAEIKRNMDVSEREFKLHSIDWYTNAGNALLDPKKYKDETDKHNAEMADLKKKLDEANAELDKIREDIRKAGLSSSIGD